MTTAPSPDEASWEEALRTLEHALREASWAVGELRRKLGSVPEPVRLQPAPPPAAPAPAQPRALVPAAVAPAMPPGAPSNGPSPAEIEENRTSAAFERLWDRLEQERVQTAEADAEESAPRSGLDLLPQQYLLTVEDREERVDLVPLHRALAGTRGIEEFALVSCANGVPVISLRVEGELDADRFTDAVSLSMQRRCELIPQENGRLFLRLKPMMERGS